MGIVGVETLMENDPRCNRRVSIPELVKKDERKVVIVDGNLFYKLYIFKKFNWICGGTIEFMEEVRKFVKSFEDLGVKLVFFFTHNNEEDELRQRWIKRRNGNIKHAMKTLNKLSNGVSVKKCLGKIGFPNRPIQMHCSVISLVRELKCEVRCYLDKHVSRMAAYANSHDCLAILSQNSAFVMYDLKCYYLSIKHFSLNKMETVEYDRYAFATSLELDCELLPLFAAVSGTNKLLREPVINGINMLLQRKLNWSKELNNRCILIAKYIKTYFVDVLPSDAPHLLTRHFGTLGQKIATQYFDFRKQFLNHSLESEEYTLDTMALNDWERMKYFSTCHYSNGHLCSKICLILRDSCYEEQTILEDFQDFPANGLVYRSLRQRMYGVLLHATPKDTDDVSEGCSVMEWCMQDGQCPADFTPVFPTSVDDAPHFSLSTLWDINNIDDHYYNEKWQLFAWCVSSILDFRVLQDLPVHLIIPTALLFYLHNEVPRKFDKYSYQFLSRWEIEVFIAVAIILPDTSFGNICSIKIDNVNLRAVKLIAIFLSGCHAMKMITDVCKCVMVNDHLLSIWRYFDGKLFHNLYEQVIGEFQFDWEKYCGPQKYNTFLKMRNIVLQLE